MRIFGLLLSFALLQAAPAGETPLSQHDRDRIMSELHASRKMFLDSLAGVSHDQWVFKAGPDRWSIQETAEHITTAEPFIREMIRKQLLASPAQPELAEKRRPMNDEVNEKIIQSLNDRSQKFQAPEPLKPKDIYATPQDAIAAFDKERTITADYIQTTNDPLRDHFAKGPAGGDMDGVQYFLLLAGHTERHVAQIKEVKESPEYPKN